MMEPNTPRPCPIPMAYAGPSVPKLPGRPIRIAILAWVMIGIGLFGVFSIVLEWPTTVRSISALKNAAPAQLTVAPAVLPTPNIEPYDGDPVSPRGLKRAGRLAFIERVAAASKLNLDLQLTLELMLVEIGGELLMVPPNGSAQMVKSAPCTIRQSQSADPAVRTLTIITASGTAQIGTRDATWRPKAGPAHVLTGFIFTPANGAPRYPMAVVRDMVAVFDESTNRVMNRIQASMLFDTTLKFDPNRQPRTQNTAANPPQLQLIKAHPQCLQIRFREATRHRDIYAFNNGQIISSTEGVDPTTGLTESQTRWNQLESKRVIFPPWLWKAAVVEQGVAMLTLLLTFVSMIILLLNWRVARLVLIGYIWFRAATVASMVLLAAFMLTSFSDIGAPAELRKGLLISGVVTVVLNAIIFAALALVAFSGTVKDYFHWRGEPDLRRGRFSRAVAKAMQRPGTTAIFWTVCGLVGLVSIAHLIALLTDATTSTSRLQHTAIPCALLLLVLFSVLVRRGMACLALIIVVFNAAPAEAQTRVNRDMSDDQLKAAVVGPSDSQASVALSFMFERTGGPVVVASWLRTGDEKAVARIMESLSPERFRVIKKRDADGAEAIRVAYAASVPVMGRVLTSAKAPQRVALIRSLTEFELEDRFLDEFAASISDLQGNSLRAK